MLQELEDIRHVCPVKPGLQKHWNEEFPFVMHKPLMHGDEKQGFMDIGELVVVVVEVVVLAKILFAHVGPVKPKVQ